MKWKEGWHSSALHLCFCDVLIKHGEQITMAGSSETWRLNKSSFSQFLSGTLITVMNVINMGTEVRTWTLWETQSKHAASVSRSPSPKQPYRDFRSFQQVVSSFSRAHIREWKWTTVPLSCPPGREGNTRKWTDLSQGVHSTLFPVHWQLAPDTCLDSGFVSRNSTAHHLPPLGKAACSSLCISGTVDIQCPGLSTHEGLQSGNCFFCFCQCGFAFLLELLVKWFTCSNPVFDFLALRFV